MNETLLKMKQIPKNLDKEEEEEVFHKLSIN